MVQDLYTRMCKKGGNFLVHYFHFHCIC